MRQEDYKVSAELTLDTPIDEVLASHPQAAEVFVRHRMLCVGCEIGRFHTLRESALFYSLDPVELIEDLKSSASTSTSTSTST
jgi:hybrid cluster-associated redox disulfide protein